MGMKIRKGRIGSDEAPAERPPLVDPHEVEGDIFPEGVQEYDATETLPPIVLTEDDQPAGLVAQVLALSKPGRGMIGRTITLGQNQADTILDWQVGDDESAIPVTILIGIPNVPNTNPAFPGRLTATVQYGIGGSQNVLTMDVTPGSIVTLPATFVRVNVSCDDSGVVGSTVDVSAFLCRFSVAHPPGKVTIYSTIALGVGAGVSRGIPSMARSFRAFVTNNAGNTGTWTVAVRNTNGVLRVAQHNMAAGVQDSGEVVIPGDGCFVEVFNTDGAIVVDNWRVVFDLY